MAIEIADLQAGRGNAWLHAALTCLAAVLAATLLSASPALASCDQTGSTVNCTGTTTNYVPGNLTNTTINVLSGAVVQGTNGTDAINVNVANTVTLNNYGTIDGRVVFIGSADFTNYGILRMTDPTTVGTGISHSIAGTFEQAASGSLFSRFDSTGANFDGLFAANAKLNGKFVAVIQPGLYTSPIDYSSVISTTFGITGAFSSITTSSPFFSATLTPSGNDLDLKLAPIAFNAVAGLTQNQKAVADVLQSLYASGTPTGSLATFYSNLFAATSVSVFDQLSGAGTAASQDATFDAGSQFSNVMLQQGLGWLIGAQSGNSAIFGAPLTYASNAKKPGYEAFAAVRPRAVEPARWRVWGAGFGASRSVNGEGSPLGSADQTTRAVGGAFGVDRQVSGDMLVGVAVGGSGSTFSVSSLSTSGRVDGGHIGAYAVKTFGHAYLASSLNYARLDNHTDRTIAGIGTTETASGRFDSDLFGGRLEFGWRHSYRGYTVTPFAAIEPSALRQHAYSETGSNTFGLNYASHTSTSLPAFFGAQIDTRYALNGGQVLSPSARVAWVHEFEPKRQIEASFISIPAAGFTVDGARAARDAVRIDAGATLALNQKTALFANFNGEFASTSTMVACTAGAKVTW